MGTVEVSRLLVGAVEICGRAFAACSSWGQIVYSPRHVCGSLTGPAPEPDSETRLDDRIKQLLRDLGTAINESISGSDDVSRQIQRIRDEGYNLYVVLDATIGLNKNDGSEEDEIRDGEPATTTELALREDPREESVQFRINVNDLGLLRALGIDPTRKVKTARRVEPLTQTSDD